MLVQTACKKLSVIAKNKKTRRKKKVYRNSGFYTNLTKEAPVFKKKKKKAHEKALQTM